MNPRIPLLDPATASGTIKDIFTATQGKMGMIPNLYRVLGHSPAALSAYLTINDQLARASLSAVVREKIALVVSQRNRCGYCISAHSLMANKMLGVPETEVTLAREGRGADAHETALLTVAARMVENRGWLSDAEVAAARADGVTDPEFVEIVALVAALTFSNYTNHLAHTPLDFPPAPDLPEEG